jgi:hypothetical protein
VSSQKILFRIVMMEDCVYTEYQSRFSLVTGISLTSSPQWLRTVRCESSLPLEHWIVGLDFICVCLYAFFLSLSYSVQVGASQQAIFQFQRAHSTSVNKIQGGVLKSSVLPPCSFINSLEKRCASLKLKRGQQATLECLKPFTNGRDLVSQI